MYNQDVYHNWLPKYFQVSINIFLLLVLMCVNATYQYTYNFAVAYGGITYEDVTLCVNALTIGMGVQIMLIPKLKVYSKMKHRMYIGMSLLIALVYMSAHTSDVALLVGMSFFMGVIKMDLLVVFFDDNKKTLVPSGDRAIFYSMYYPIIFGIAQFVGIFSVYLAEWYHWQLPFQATIVLLLIGLLLVHIFMHNQYLTKPVPLYNFDWFSMGVFASAFLLINYALTMMKQKGWFEDEGIRYSLFFGLALLIMGLLRQKYVKRPFYDIKAFTNKNFYSALILLFLLGIYMSGATLQMLWYRVLGYDEITVVEFNYTLCLGFFVAAVLGYIGFVRKWQLIYYTLFGFCAMILYVYMVYVGVGMQISPSYLHWLSFFRGLGILTLFVSIFYQAILGFTSMHQGITAFSFLIICRSFLSVALANSVMYYLFYHLQWESITFLNSFTPLEPNSAMHTTDLTMQATIVGIKNLAGLILLISPLVILYVSSHPYGFFPFRKNSPLIMRWLKKK